MAIRRPFLITMIAVGYIVTALLNLAIVSRVFGENPFPALVSGSDTELVLLGGLQFIFGLALFHGARWSWWLVVLGALVPIFSDILGGLRGQQWGWGTIFWNMLVLAYMQSRDVQAFFGREAY